MVNTAAAAGTGAFGPFKGEGKRRPTPSAIACTGRPFHVPAQMNAWR